MNLSRRQKNTYLILSNVLLFLLKIYKSSQVNLNLTEIYWMAGLMLILVFYTLPLKAKGLQKFQHMSLFLLSGWAIGISLAAFFSGDGLILAEKLWIPLALVVAYLHYSPSKKDEYTAT